MMAAKKISKKIVVLGDPAVGKTSLIRRFVIDAFDDKYLTTIGAKIVKKEVPLRSGGAKPDMDVTLMIWDIAGQKTLGNVKQAYYRGAEGAMIICDITRRETLLATIDWIKTLMQVTGEIPVVLLANKCDLMDQALFGDKEMQEVSNKLNAPFLLTSAKDGRNVNAAFQSIASQMVEGIG